METWFFFPGEGETIRLMGRLEDIDTGTIGDGFQECGPGESFGNLSYEELKAVGRGKIVVRDGAYAIDIDND